MGIGNRLKEAREAANLTQEELGRLVGVTGSAITNYEKETSHPREAVMYALINTLGIEPNFLFQDCVNIKKASSLSDEAKKVGERYAALDNHGRTVVGIVLTEEEKRMEQERKKARSKRHDGSMEDEDESPRIIPLYYEPAAAGYPSPVFDVDFEFIEVGGDVPTYADFAVQIDGDSMEPYIMDGATVYVNKDPLANGDVGIFCYDGAMLCKQYYRSPRGVVWLLSLNRERKSTDRRIPVDTDLSLMCYGRVILPVKPNLAAPESELT